MIRKLLFFILYNAGLPALMRRKMVNDKAIAVLLFHRISNSTDLLWPAMPIKSFEKLLLKIKAKSEIISFSDLTSIKSYPSKPLIILSFDDGYIDFHEHAMPILISLNMKANHNICPGLIDLKTIPWTQILSLYLSYKTSENKPFNQLMSIEKQDVYNEKKFIALCMVLLRYNDNERNKLISPLLNHIPKEKIYQLMNWDQIRFCFANQIEIGSHGYLHRNLLQVWDTKELENEINDSSNKIEIEIGQKPKVFAFANAMGNEESKKFVLQSGYQFTLILMDKLLKWKPLLPHEKIQVPRINISRSDWREEYLRSLGFHAYIKQFLKFI